VNCEGRVFFLKTTPLHSAFWIGDEDKNEVFTYPAIAERVKAVEVDRLKKNKAVNKLAARPHQFIEFKGDEAKKIFVPIVS